MRKSQLPYRLQLRLLAVAVETGTLSQDEGKLLATLLRGLGEGESVEKILGLPIKRGRPRSARPDSLVWDVAVLMRPKEHGGEGLSKAKAIEEVAGLTATPYALIEEHYRSARGKEIRKAVTEAIVNPLAHPPR